ncbi:MAG TPA: peptidase [Actinoplanes sp.]|nr:peptidase [Actinoplanes sp.]
MYAALAATLLLAPAGSAGTSFLNATPLATARPTQVAAVTGDYLYWSFPATAGQQPDLTAKVTLPAAADRHGPQAWTIEVFDGLRRRQPCVAGEQSPVAAADAAEVTLGCRLRQVRSWAEPADLDPLPGTYFVRLSSTAMPERDLGLPVKVDLSLTAEVGDTGADQGTLAAPLDPVNHPGAVLTDVPQPTASAEPATTASFLPEFSSRWVWTTTGGVLAAVAGLVGFSFTRRRARRP